MLTNRRSTMMVPPTRMPSWHPQSKPAPQYAAAAPLTFDVETLQSRTPAILTSTMSTLPGHRVLRVLGTVHGTTNATRKDTKSFIKSIASSFGGNWGEAKNITSLLYHARDQAIDRMVKEAIAKGSNAIIGLEIRESEILGSLVVSVSGTACWVEKERYSKRDSAQETDPFEWQDAKAICI